MQCCSGRALTGSSGFWLTSWRGSSGRWSRRIRVNSLMNTASPSFARTATWKTKDPVRGVLQVDANQLQTNATAFWVKLLKCWGWPYMSVVMSVKYLLLIYSLRALNPFSKEAKTTKVIVKTSFERSLFSSLPFPSSISNVTLPNVLKNMQMETQGGGN